MTTPNQPFLRGLISVLALAAVGGWAEAARAGGMYFADRGARPLGRAGAFIAGGDDLGAVAYNPAGIYEAGSQFLFDGAWLHFTSDYARRAIVHQVDPNTGALVGSYEKTFESVHGTSPVLPIPTIVGSFQPESHWVVAIGAWAPYSAITTYPETVKTQPAPQRYSLITLDGSALALVGASVAYAPSEQWRIGLGAGALAGTFKSSVALSSCLPEKFFCSPENPSWDVASELDVGPIVSPAGEAGVLFIPHKDWRFGAAFSTPIFVNAPAKVHTRLPSTPIFDKATQQGEDSTVSFTLPWTLRFGIETRAVENLRVEVGFGYEAWSMHDAITLKKDNITLHDIAGFPESYQVSDMKMERNFQDSMSVRLGGEYAFKLWDYDWSALAGLSYETSAIPPEYLSVLTLDSNKLATSLGLGLHMGRWRFDVSYAHVFASTVDVPATEAKLKALNPVVANPPKVVNTINGGTYEMRADVLALGLAYTFEKGPADAAKQPASPERAPLREPQSE